MAAYAICWRQIYIKSFTMIYRKTHVASSICLRPTIFQNPDGTLWTHCIYFLPHHLISQQRAYLTPSVILFPILIIWFYIYCDLEAAIKAFYGLLCRNDFNETKSYQVYFRLQLKVDDKHPVQELRHTLWNSKNRSNV
jgi:hypothetical protein